MRLTSIPGQTIPHTRSRAEVNRLVLYNNSSHPLLLASGRDRDRPSEQHHRLVAIHGTLQHLLVQRLDCAMWSRFFATNR